MERFFLLFNPFAIPLVGMVHVDSDPNDKVSNKDNYCFFLKVILNSEIEDDISRVMTLFEEKEAIYEGRCNHILFFRYHQFLLSDLMIKEINQIVLIREMKHAF